MALPAGTLAFTIHFGQNLKDGDWFGKQDPYAVIKIGGQTFRTQTHKGAGRSPVWGETFSYNVINENTAEVSIFDEDTMRDDLLGVAVVPLAKTREQGSDRMEVPVVSKKSGKQHGIIMVSMAFTANDAIRQSQQLQQHTNQAGMMQAGYGMHTGVAQPLGQYMTHYRMPI